MATRKRARDDDGQFKADDPATAINEAFEVEQELSVDSLAAFIADEKPDRQRLEQALALAKEAALAFTGEAVADTAPHAIRHGVHLLAAQLLITNQLETAPAEVNIPLVVRYFWRLSDAGRQP